MPGFIGKKLCPELVLVALNFKKYTAVSTEIRFILAQYDPGFSPMSLDEAYLDFTQHLKERSSLNDEERTYPQVVEDVAYCACAACQQRKQNAEGLTLHFHTFSECSAFSVDSISFRARCFFLYAYTLIT